MKHKHSFVFTALSSLFLLCDALPPAVNAQATQTVTDTEAQSQDAGKGNVKPAPTMPDVLQKDHPDNPNDIDDLVAIVRAKNKETQERAAMKLADPDPKAMAALKDKYLSLLDDKVAGIKRAAMLGCGKLNIRESIPKIRAVLRSTPKSVLGTVAQHGIFASEAYGNAMTAAQALGRLKDVESVPDILDRDMLSISWGVVLPPFGPKALPIVAERCRGAAKNKKMAYLRAITGFNAPENVAQLQELLKDPDADIRTTASMAMGQIAALGKKEDASTGQATKAIQDNYDSLSDSGKDDYFNYCVYAKCDIDKNMERAKKFFADHNYAVGPESGILIALCETGNPKLVPFMREALKWPDPIGFLHTNAACCLLHLTGKLPDLPQDPQTDNALKNCMFLSKEQKEEVYKRLNKRLTHGQLKVPD